MKKSLSNIFATLLGIAATVVPATASAATPGQTMADGSRFVSFAPGGKALFTTPHDVRGPLSLSQLTKYCSNSTFGGKSDWRVPSTADAFALALNSDAIGNFAKPGKFPHGYYHSSSVFNNITGPRAVAINPESGSMMPYKKNANFYMLGRCVRSESIFTANILTVR